MVGSKIKTVKKVCTKYWLAYIGDDEGEVEFSIFDADLTVREAVAGDV